MRIGDWQFDLDTGVLSKGETSTTLTPKSASVLRYLVERPDQLISSDELLEEFWPGTFATDNAVQKAISEIRRQLGDDSKHPKYVKTVNRRGYMFVASSQPATTDNPNTVSESVTPTQPISSSWSRTVLLALAGGVVVLAISIVLFRVFDQTAIDAEAGPPLTAIVVLPFDDMTPNSDHAWLANGMTEALTESLSRIQALQVIARTSAQAVKRQQVDITSISEQLKVDTVVESSVRRAGDQIRITVQLIRAADGVHLWSANYDQKIEDVLAVQSKISQQIAEAIRTELNIKDGPSWLQQSRYSTPDVRAYELVRKAVEREDTRTKEGFFDEISYGQQALEIDPNYAEAHARMAWGHYFLWMYRFEPQPERRARAIAGANQALAINPSNGSAANLLIEVAMNDGDWQTAEERVKQALETYPNHGPLRSSYAHILANTGRLPGALAQIRRADSLDPVGGFLQGLGHIYLANDDIESAIEVFEKYRTQRSWQAIGPLYYAYYAVGRDEDALEFMLELTQPENVESIRDTFETGGFRNALRMSLDMFYQERCPISPFLLAITQEEERLFKCLDERIEQKRAGFLLLKVHPAYKAYHDDPRFIALLRKMNLAD